MKSDQKIRRTHILLITGPAGVGKSTLCWEMSARLSEGIWKSEQSG